MPTTASLPVSVTISTSHQVFAAGSSLRVLLVLQSCLQRGLRGADNLGALGDVLALQLRLHLDLAPFVQPFQRGTLFFPMLLRHGLVLVEEVAGGSGTFQSLMGLYTNELAALAARYEQFCLLATFCGQCCYTECTINPARWKLIARLCAGCGSSGSTIHISSPS